MNNGELFENVLIIIPALDPDEKMIKLIRELRENGAREILLVDDGSKVENKYLFKKAVDEFECKLFVHYKNFGKGRALKNAFNYALENFQLKGVITVDSDGQHCVKDIIQCAKLLTNSDGTKKLFLGVRDFDGENIPARSRFGNKMTRIVLKLFCGIKITDTQTGLRGITVKALEEMLDLIGERYEYEMNMIIETKELEIEIEEFPIETIYINENETSHFNPVTDSIKIYRQFLKYIFASLSSFVIDMVLFSVLSSILKINNSNFALE